MSRPRKPDTTGKVIGTIDISIGADGVVAGPETKSVADLVGKNPCGGNKSSRHNIGAICVVRHWAIASTISICS